MSESVPKPADADTASPPVAGEVWGVAAKAGADARRMWYYTPEICRSQPGAADYGFGVVRFPAKLPPRHD